MAGHALLTRTDVGCGGNRRKWKWSRESDEVFLGRAVIGVRRATRVVIVHHIG